MADTLKFGPEWLRQLSGGNSVGTPPPSPAPGFGKYKLADYRYGREEMLALYIRNEEIPDELKQYTAILSEKAQDPLAFQNLSEEEQQIMAQSVNSQAVLRMMGRGAPSMRGRGGGIDRGRGRGRGRGDGFMQRGMSYDEMEGGGFGRPRPRPDGSWDEGDRFSNPAKDERKLAVSYDDRGLSTGPSQEQCDPKAYQRSFSNRYIDPTQPNKGYQRSLSSENWRDRDEDDDNGDWRRAGGSKWNNSRTTWREGTHQRGFDYDRSQRGGFNRQHSWQQRENWDEEDLPEWSIDGDPDEVGTFDSSGAFVSPKKGRRREEGDFEGENPENSPRENSPPSNNKTERGKEENKENGMKDINDNRTKKNEIENKEELKSPDENKPPQKQKVSDPKKNSAQNHVTKTANENRKPDKPAEPPQPSPSPARKTNKTQQKSAQPVDNAENKEANKKVDQNKSNNSNKPAKQVEKVVKESAESATSKNANTKVPKDSSKETVNTNTSSNKRREKLKSEAEALDQLQETVENMVAGITVLEDDDEADVSTTKQTQSGALPPDHENYNKWFYRDPQGDLQGPFTSNEMAEWFSAGYFTMNLSVRRGCDEQFSPLGELIKRWGRVPFLPGPSPPPFMNRTSPDISKQQQQQQQQEHMQAIQQQLLIQQQLVQQQMLMRHLQLQQMQQVMSQLQENEQFKSLPPLQQQQLAMQMMLKQGNPAAAATQQSQQKLSPRSSEAPVTSSSTHPTYNRSFSTPNTSQGQNVAGSIWDIDPGTTSMPAGGITAAELESQLKEKEQIEVERKYQEMLEREKEALRKQQEEVQRQKEEIERERLEIERRKQEELKKIEEERLRAEEEKRKLEEEHRRHLEEKKREEEERRMMEEEMRRQQDVERQKELQRQQEIQREQEAQRLKEQEERERQKQQELQRRQQEDALRKQQNEALRKLQQEQMSNMQLPSHAQWANSQTQMGAPTGKSLLEIQQQEEKERIEREELQRKQMEAQRQQMMALQQQQQQKSWTSTASAPQGTKSLVEIQQEQARQLERERQKREENHQIAAKNMSLGSASVWGTSPPLTNWANEGAWGAIKSAQLNVNMNSNSSNNALGFWDDAIISSSGPVKKQSNKPSSKQQTAEFPALSGDNPNKGKAAAQSKAKPSKSKKEEEAVQRLFQPFPQEDDFTLWCKKQLKNMATSVDIPTFIAFLQEVESPYEVHDYVRSYLGENKVTEDFAKAFLEKRSQFRSKSKPAVQEDSIWGPAPAITPRELRQPIQSFSEDGPKGKANKKKKNKMLKVDASILGFTVHAAPDRIVGEIDSLEANPR